VVHALLIEGQVSAGTLRPYRAPLAAALITGSRILLAAAFIQLLLTSNRRIRQPVIAAFVLLTLNDRLMIVAITQGQSPHPVFEPIRGNLALWSIVLLG
jgi:hypothetical protein